MLLGKEQFVVGILEVCRNKIYCCVPCLVAQSCLTILDSMDCSLPDSSGSMGILQARILEWVAMPSQGNLPNLGLKPGSLPLQRQITVRPSGKPAVLKGKLALMDFHKL